jgi:hypothetical protein
MRHAWIIGLMVVSLAFLAGCGSEQPEQQQAAPPPAGAAKVILTAEPAGAKGVIDVRKEAKDKDSVVVVGRIGGEKAPFVKDRAAFWIADPSIQACNEIEDDNCPYPWDFCCTRDPETNLAFVKVVDEQGKLINYDAKTLLNVKELDTVVVQGTAQRDANNNLTILAKGVYVRKKGQP